MKQNRERSHTESGYLDSPENLLIDMWWYETPSGDFRIIHRGQGWCIQAFINHEIKILGNGANLLQGIAILSLLLGCDREKVKAWLKARKVPVKHPLAIHRNMLKKLELWRNS